jgi:hypothetical protein
VSSSNVSIRLRSSISALLSLVVPNHAAARFPAETVLQNALISGLSQICDDALSVVLDLHLPSPHESSPVIFKQVKLTCFTSSNTEPYCPKSLAAKFSKQRGALAPPAKLLQLREGQQAPQQSKKEGAKRRGERNMRRQNKVLQNLSVNYQVFIILRLQSANLLREQCRTICFSPTGWICSSQSAPQCCTRKVLNPMSAAANFRRSDLHQAWKAIPILFYNFPGREPCATKMYEVNKREGTPSRIGWRLQWRLISWKDT